MTMAYDFLKKLFKKDENGAIIPMTAEELEAAIDADKNIKIVDLSAGGYIAKDKFDAKETELKGVKKQLEDANRWQLRADPTLRICSSLDISSHQKPQEKAYWTN